MKFRRRGVRQRANYMADFPISNGMVETDRYNTTYTDFRVVNEMEVLYQREIMTLRELNLGPSVSVTQPETWVADIFVDFLSYTPDMFKIMDIVRDHVSETHFLVLVNKIVEDIVRTRSMENSLQLIEQMIKADQGGEHVEDFLIRSGIPNPEKAFQYPDPRERSGDYETDYETDYEKEFVINTEGKMRAFEPQNYIRQLALYADALHDFGDVKRMGVDELGGGLPDNRKKGVVTVVKEITNRLWSETRAIDPVHTLKSFIKVKNEIERESVTKGFFCPLTDMSGIRRVLSTLITSSDQLLRDARGAGAVLKRLGFNPTPRQVPFERAFDPNGPNESTQRRRLNYTSIIRPPRTDLPGISDFIQVTLNNQIENIMTDGPGIEPGVLGLRSRYPSPPGSPYSITIGNKANVPAIAREIDRVIQLRGTNVSRWDEGTRQYILSLLALKRAGDQGQAEYIGLLSRENPGTPFFFETADYFAGTYALLRDINLITSFLERAGVPYFYLRNLSERLTNNISYKLLEKDFTQTRNYLLSGSRIITEDPAYENQVRGWLMYIENRILREANDLDPNGTNKIDVFTDIGKMLSATEWIFKFFYEQGVDLVEKMGTFMANINQVVLENLGSRGILRVSSFVKTFLANSVDGNYHRNQMEALASTLDTFVTSCKILTESGFPLPARLSLFLSSFDGIVQQGVLDFMTDMEGRVQKIFDKFGMGKIINSEGFEILFSALVNGVRTLLGIRYQRWPTPPAAVVRRV